MDNINNIDLISTNLLLKKKNKNLKRNYLRLKNKFLDQLNKNNECIEQIKSLEKKMEWNDDWENI